jgi:hypothetical protein
VTVPEPHLAETTSLKIVITEVYAGERYNDTPIAEVEVWGRTSGGEGERGRGTGACLRNHQERAIFVVK